jgi:hypothetical protein
MSYFRTKEIPIFVWPYDDRLMQGCQIFLGKTYQNGKIYQMATKCTKWTLILTLILKYANIFDSKAVQSVPKFWFLVWKYIYHLANLDLFRFFRSFYFLVFALSTIDILTFERCCSSRIVEKVVSFISLPRFTNSFFNRTRNNPVVYLYTFM